MSTELKKTKIIFTGRYNETEKMSGPEKVAKRIYSELQEMTDSVFIEYFFDGSKYSIWQKLFGSGRIIDAKNKRVFRLGIFQILLFMINFKPKIVHILSFERFTLIFFFFKFFLRFKISYTINGIVVFENSAFRKNIATSLKIKDKIVERCIIKFSNKLFFLSEQSINIARKFYNIPNEKIILTANGIDEIFNQVFLKRQYKEKSKLNIVLIADSARVEKGLDFFLKAIQPIKNDFIFNIIGENLTADNHINYFHKMPTEDFAKFLLDQDIFISASYFDSFSIAATESMASGIIPIVTRETGISRFITNGVNGFVFSYGDIETLLEYLSIIKESKELITKISKNAALIYDTLKWKNISDAYFEEFNKLIFEK